MIKLTKARTDIILDSPFFGSLVFKLKPVETDSVPTMATDGKELLYNKDFVNQLTSAQLIGVLCHELLHCAFLHHLRRGDRDPQRWNAACDYAINGILLDDFRLTLPEDRLYDPQYTGMSAEAIYTALPEQPPAPQWGMVNDGQGDADNGSVQEQEADWAAAVSTAAQAAKAAGKLPDKFDALIKKAQAKVNWREQLRSLMGSVSRSNYNWYPGDTRYVHHNLFLPALNEPSLGHLVLAIDTSGSVSEAELSQFLGEIQHIVDEQHRESLTVIHCDADIAKIEEIEEGEEIPGKVYGRGGTRFQPVFDYCNEHPTDALIYFTDMYPCDGWPEQPAYPVFWGRTSDVDAPYGSHIDVFRH